MSLTVSIAASLGLNADKRRSEDPKSSANVRVGLLLVYMVGNFEIEGIIWVGKGWITSPADQQFNLGRGGGPCGAARK